MRTLRLDAVTADGVPRNVAVEQSRTRVAIGRVQKYDQRSFTPRLFADGGTFYAYTVEGGSLVRWGLYRGRDGRVRYDHPVRVGKGFRSWSSLQVGTYGAVRGVQSEIVYGTTTAGELHQVAVPLKHPTRARDRVLASSGYAGVTEMSWGRCGKDYRDDVLVSIDPVANRADWTTIEEATTRPRATLRGPVTGETDWNLSAAF